MFGDNWRRIKASKLWNPYDISDALILKVMGSGNISAVNELLNQAYVLGMEDGIRMFSRAGHEKSRLMLAESFLLMCGVPFERSSVDTYTGTIRVRLTPLSHHISIFSEPDVRVAYIKGYLSSLIPDGSFKDMEDEFLYTYRIPSQSV